MELIYKGKTKNIYKNNEGNFVLKFKDDVTGENGVFDPGANQVGLSIEGVGKEGLKATKYFFDLLAKENVATHYIDSNLEENTMTVKPAKTFGKGIEVICRFKAVGSFLKRYALYAKNGQDLDAYVEITLKDDERNDPLITKDGLDILGILNPSDYDKIVSLTKKICLIIKKELKNKGLDLFDIKLEFGKLEDSGEIILIDEISGGNMRVFENDKYIEPLYLNSYLLK